MQKKGKQKTQQQTVKEIAEIERLKCGKGTCHRYLVTMDDEVQYTILNCDCNNKCIFSDQLPKVGQSFRSQKSFYDFCFSVKSPNRASIERTMERRKKRKKERRITKILLLITLLLSIITNTVMDYLSGANILESICNSIILISLFCIYDMIFTYGRRIIKIISKGGK